MNQNLTCYTFLQRNLISNGIFIDVVMPSADCPYEAPDECSSEEPQSCCAGSGTPPQLQVGVYWLPYTLTCAISVATLVLLSGLDYS